MENNEHKNWRLKRNRGFIHFLIFDGILKVGLPATIASQISFYLYDSGFTTDKAAEWFTTSRVSFLILSAVIIGLLFTIFVRARNGNAVKD
jgi:hypothetical protein